MKAKIYGAIGLAKKARVELPSVFDTPYRPDLIKRAVLAVQSTRRQPKATKYQAGWSVATSWGTGRGAARTPRSHGRRTHSAQRGALVNYTVGGRVAHPPKAEKQIVENINTKERKLAIRSAIAATTNKDLVLKRGHVADSFELLPIVFEDAIHDKVSKTKEAVELLTKIGLINDIDRAKNGRKIRAGKGKGRGRKYKSPVGPLIVTDRDSDFCNSIRNLPGIEIVNVKYLNTEMLAPGTHAGRLTVWMEKTLEIVEGRYPSKKVLSATTT
ncbi:MAG TPA: 50S ribosomal protein L4 [candidate division Zixibacteria bacterium]|nr:50S ribosomal protein L4 [candidate division Zixibacteria bacterium]